MSGFSARKTGKKFLPSDKALYVGPFHLVSLRARKGEMAEWLKALPC